MKWKCEADDRYIKFTLDDGQTADMCGREEAFGPHYAVLSELYRKKARLAVVEKTGWERSSRRRRGVSSRRTCRASGRSCARISVMSCM